MLSVHAASHGAGQMRPVNSGKLLVESSTAKARLPVGAIDQVVEVGNDVVDRAAAVAERRAAVHAARALHLGLVFLQREDELAVVLDPLGHRLVVFLHALEVHEAGDVAHFPALLLAVAAARYFGATILMTFAGLPDGARLGDRIVGSARGADLAERRHRLQADLGQRALVLVREHLDELRQRLAPVVEDLARAQAAGPLVVIGDERLQQRLVGLLAVPDRALERLLLLGDRQRRAPSETIEVLQRDANWPSSS